MSREINVSTLYLDFWSDVFVSVSVSRYVLRKKLYKNQIDQNVTGWKTYRPLFGFLNIQKDFFHNKEEQRFFLFFLRRNYEEYEPNKPPLYYDVPLQQNIVFIATIGENTMIKLGLVRL